MARKRPTAAEPPPSARRSSALVAAAAPVDTTSSSQVKRITARQQRWQPEAWAYYKSIGVISDVLGYRANVASKVRLFAAWDPPGTDTPPIPVSAAVEEKMTSEAVASQATDVLFGLESGQGIAAMLHKLFLNLDIPGECHVIGEDTDDGQQWFAYSNSELRQTSAGKLSIVEGPNEPRGRPVADGAVAFRIWQPDPEFASLAFSPMRPLVEEGVCERLLIVGNQVRSDLKSRLPKGIVAFAQEMTLARAQNADGNRTQLDDGDGGPTMQAELIEVAQMALAGDGGPSDSVPLVVEVPSALIANKSWADKLELGQMIDPKALELMKDLTAQILSGLPLPPEIGEGLGATNHWSAATIERGAFRHFIEPGVLAICHGLTIGFYRPMLLAAGVDRSVVERLCVWYDESEAITERDRTEVAHEGVRLGTIGAEAWRRVCEFDEEDAPSEEELQLRLAMQGAVSPELQAALLRLLGVVDAATMPAPTPPAPMELPPAPEPPTDEEPDTLERAERPVTAAGPPVSDVGERLAAIDRRLFDQALTAADMALERAVERAANRLRSLANRDTSAKALIAGRPVGEIAGRLGRSHVARLAAADLDEDDAIATLVAGSFTALVTRLDALTERAQQATVAEALALSLDEDRPSDTELATLAAAQADDRERAWTALVAALTALAVSVLFDGRPDPGEGEVDPHAIVPAAVIRESLAVAGGAVNVERTGVGGLSVDGRPVGGVATGERSRTLFARVRAWWTGYRWEYGDASTRERPFPPHQALDGREFARWDSPELANTEATWIGNLSYQVGDHKGCRCSFVPTILTPIASEQAA